MGALKTNLKESRGISYSGGNVTVHKIGEGTEMIGEESGRNIQNPTVSAVRFLQGLGRDGIEAGHKGKGLQEDRQICKCKHQNE